MQISNLCLRRFWHRAMKHPSSQMSGSSELWNEKTNKPNHSSPVNLLLSGQMPWCQESFIPWSHTSWQCQKKKKKYPEIYWTRKHNGSSPQRNGVCGHTGAPGWGCVGKCVQHLVPAFLLSQIIHLIHPWSKLPLESDGFTGEGPGLCIEVSGMSWMCQQSLWIPLLINYVA